MRKNKFVIDSDIWIIIVIVFGLGICFLFAYLIHEEKVNCLKNSGKWVEAVNSNGSVSYFCIPK